MFVVPTNKFKSLLIVYNANINKTKSHVLELVAIRKLLHKNVTFIYYMLHYIVTWK